MNVACLPFHHIRRLFSFIRIISNGYKKHDLPGPYYSLTHSIHAINNNEIGITDTGNSCIRIFNKADKDIKIFKETYETFTKQEIEPKTLKLFYAG